MSEYEITQEIKDLFEESIVARNCRDRAIKLWLNTKKAIKFETISMRARKKAWGLIGELYPETKTETFHYNYETGELRKGTAEAYQAKQDKVEK